MPILSYYLDRVQALTEFVEYLAEKLIEYAESNPELKEALSDFGVAGVSVEKPEEITLEHQKILAKINQEFSKNIKNDKYLPNYGRDIPKIDEYRIIIAKLPEIGIMQNFVNMESSKEPKIEEVHSESESLVGEASSSTVFASEGDSQSEVEYVMASTPTVYSTTREADDQLITLNGEQQRSEVPSHGPVAPFSGHDQNQNIINKKDDESQQHLQTEPQNNSKYWYIGGCAMAGLTIGLAVAYFAGAATLTPVLAAVSVFIGAAVVGIFVGTLLGAGVDYGVSKCLNDPKCERQQQPEIHQPCIS